MMILRILFILIAIAAFSGCRNRENEDYISLADQAADSPVNELSETNTIDTRNTKPESIVKYARTLLGTPYLYASTDPSAGFDCSGFITYVFQHFNVKVPRSSIDFTNEGKQVSLKKTKPGDLILFTGTDSTNRHVGHMGIITCNQDGKIEFIHSTSGKAKGVVITPLENYYRSRFMKVIRVFPDASFKNQKTKT
jgi:cell wall-associated NlpC family hydrolase